MSLHPTFDLVLRTAERLRVELPAETTDTYLRFLAIVERAPSDAAAPGELRRVIAECVTDGADPHLDADVVDSAARLELAGSNLRGTLLDLSAGLLAEHAEAMFAAFGERFDEAATILTGSSLAMPAAHRRGRSAAPQAPPLLADGPPAGQNDAWDRARYGEAVINEIQLLWKRLSISATRFPSPAHRQLLIIADVPPELWFELGADGVKVTPWGAARLGLRFSLASPATFHKRCAALGAYVESEEERHRQAVREAAQAKTAPQPHTDPLAYAGAVTDG